MPCYNPLRGFYSAELNADGKRSIVFDKRKANTGVPITIPCSECVGCRLSWRRQWAVRCMHEKRMHRESAFLTLTYDDDHLPARRSLCLRDLQLFMKRLRRVRPQGLRFFACGEYGDSFQRPHYHVLLFNTDFADRRMYKQSPAGEPLYRSGELSGLWGAGNADVGAVTFGSAAYVAGYVLKKVTKPPVCDGRLPEFRVMSRRPGIGAGWFERYCEEAYRFDSAIMDAREVPLPRFYDTKMAVVDVDRMVSLKRDRKRKALFTNPGDRTKARMMTRERFEILKLERFARDV